MTDHSPVCRGSGRVRAGMVWILAWGIGCIQSPAGWGQTAPPTAVESPSRAASGERDTFWPFEKAGALVYSQGDDYRLTCDLYTPRTEGPFPVVLAIHGGAWRSGSKLHLVRHAWALTEAGYAVMAINYRHAPRYPFPAQLEDCRAALAWLRENAGNYRIDPDRIALFGYSAGGHLAALLAAEASAEGDDSRVGGPHEVPARGTVRAVVVGGAPAEFSWIAPRSTGLAYLFGGSRAQYPERYEQASPALQVHPGMPPTRLVHGANDWLVPPSTSQKFYRALQAKGVPAELELVQQGHFGAFSDFESFARSIEFLDRTLRRSPPLDAREQP